MCNQNITWFCLLQIFNDVLNKYFSEYFSCSFFTVTLKSDYRTMVYRCCSLQESRSNFPPSGEADSVRMLQVNDLTSDWPSENSVTIHFLARIVRDEKD